MFSSWFWPQWFVAGYVVLVLIGTPVVRAIQIRRGSKGFGPWGEFWGLWSVDFVIKLVLVVVLFFGGFWG